MTSQAATTMTMIAKIWPSPLPCMRLKATSARFAALSMSSRQSRITSGLRRVSTPAAPMVNTSAETARYQPMCHAAPALPPSVGQPRARGVVLGLVGPRVRARRPAERLAHRAGAVGHAEELGDRQATVAGGAAPAREDDRADGRDEQQERRDLERRAGTS